MHLFSEGASQTVQRYVPTVLNVTRQLRNTDRKSVINAGGRYIGCHSAESEEE